MALDAVDVEAGPLSVTVQAVGVIESGQGLPRSGACVGDQILVTGTLGDAARALQHFYAGKPCPAFLQQRLDRPQPRCDAGIKLSAFANAAIDISDGLSADLGHILQDSHVGAVVDVDSLPVSAALLTDCNQAQRLQCQLNGGDDYELCFTVSQDKLYSLMSNWSDDDIPIMRIGEITDSGELIFLQHGQALEIPGSAYDHFHSNHGPVT
jgi:thiamine-monophosphate kinase